MGEEMFKEKYLKYKIKYLELKETLEKSNVDGGNGDGGNGGNHDVFLTIEQRIKQRKEQRERQEEEYIFKKNIDYIKYNINVLEEKYLNFKKNTCGFSGCRVYANFMRFVNSMEQEFIVKWKFAPDILKETVEYKKINDNIKKYKNEVFSKQKECKCMSWF